MKNLFYRRLVSILRVWMVLAMLFQQNGVNANAKSSEATASSVIFEDARFFEEPGFYLNDLTILLMEQGGQLATADVTCGGQQCTAAESIYDSGNTFNYSLNVLLLTTLIELKSGLVTNPETAASDINNPLMLKSSIGFESQINTVSQSLIVAFYAYKPGMVIHFSDGSSYSVASETNAASYAIMAVLADMTPDRATWDAQVKPDDGAFVLAFNKLASTARKSKKLLPLQVQSSGDTAFLSQPYAGNPVNINSYFDRDSKTKNATTYKGETGKAYTNHRGYDYQSSGRNVLAAADGKVDLVYINREESGHGVTWCIGFPYTKVTAMQIRHDPDGDGVFQYVTMYWHLIEVRKNILKNHRVA